LGLSVVFREPLRYPGRVPTLVAPGFLVAPIKIFGPIADGADVSSRTHLHDLPGSELELLGFARFWLWERFIEDHLPRVLVDDDLTTVFQPIYRLTEEDHVVEAYEALARFPVAYSIPVALWFRIARKIGFGTQLEMAAIKAALRSADLLPEDSSLFINASVETLTELIGVVDSGTRNRLVIDIPFADLSHPDFITAVNRLRREGIKISVDDVPLSDLHIHRPMLTTLEPDYVKVDVLVGLAHNVMGTVNLAEAAVWCHDAEIDIIAERVERHEDLVMLGDLGVDWAQGFSLSEPLVML
jgi:EAL domain-containing protein (putative c-di-GMP-specific phosphodiesterase class I)